MLKNLKTVIKIEISMYMSKSRLDKTEEKKGKLGDKIEEITQNSMQKNRKYEKKRETAKKGQKQKSQTILIKNKKQNIEDKNKKYFKA